jgi:hypothetical protein
MRKKGCITKLARILDKKDAPAVFEAAGAEILPGEKALNAARGYLFPFPFKSPFRALARASPR